MPAGKVWVVKEMAKNTDSLPRSKSVSKPFCLAIVESQLRGTRPSITNRWGEVEVAGTRACSGRCGGDGGLDLMGPQDVNPNHIGPVRYDINSEFGRFINRVGGVHDFMNSWNYAPNGDVIGRGAAFANFFGVYSGLGMPPALGYTGFAWGATIAPSYLYHYQH